MNRKTNYIKAALLPRWSVTRPVTVVMTFIALLVVGTIAYTHIPIELFPGGLDWPWMGVWVPYHNTNPWEVEDRITKPVEEILHTVRGIKKMRSRSHSWGCWTSIEFHQDTDMDLAYYEVRDRLDRVMPQLPDDVERTYIRKWSDEDDPIVWAAIALGPNIDDQYHFLWIPISKSRWSVSRGWLMWRFGALRRNTFRFSSTWTV